MGQYYIAVFLEPRRAGARDVIRNFTAPGLGKLMETSYLRNPYVQGVEAALTRDGPAYKTRVVWAGDYADAEPAADDGDDEARNLYAIAEDEEDKYLHLETAVAVDEYRYIVNHDVRTYVDKQRLTSRVHPLPLLTAEGNGGGGGDYAGSDMDKVGLWARATLSVEKDVPEGFTELVVNFVVGAVATSRATEVDDEDDDEKV
jgi:hypothetical protein